MKVLAAVKLHSLNNKKMLSHAEFRDVAPAKFAIATECLYLQPQ
jgi:hypothetical protein